MAPTHLMDALHAVEGGVFGSLGDTELMGRSCLQGFLMLLPRTASMFVAEHEARSSTVSTATDEPPTKRRKVGPFTPTELKSRLHKLQTSLKVVDSSAEVCVALLTHLLSAEQQISEAKVVPIEAVLDLAFSDPATCLRAVLTQLSDPSSWGYVAAADPAVKRAIFMTHTVAMLSKMNATDGMAFCVGYLYDLWRVPAGVHDSVKQEMTASFFANAGGQVVHTILQDIAKVRTKAEDLQVGALLERSLDYIFEVSDDFYCALLTVWIGSGVGLMFAVRRALRNPPHKVDNSKKCLALLQSKPLAYKIMCDLAHQAPPGGWGLLNLNHEEGTKVLLTSAVMGAGRGTRLASEEFRAIAKSLVEGRELTAQGACFALCALMMLPEVQDGDNVLLQTCLANSNACVLAATLSVYANEREGRHKDAAGMLVFDLLQLSSELRGWAKPGVVLHESGMRMLGQFLPVSDLPEFVSAINLLSFEPNVCRGSSLLVMAAKHAHTRNVMRSSVAEVAARKQGLFTWAIGALEGHPSEKAIPSCFLSTLSFLTKAHLPAFPLTPGEVVVRTVNAVALCTEEVDASQSTEANIAHLNRLVQSTYPVILLLEGLKTPFCNESELIECLLKCPLKTLGKLLRARARLYGIVEKNDDLDASQLALHYDKLVDALFPHHRITMVGNLFAGDALRGDGRADNYLNLADIYRNGGADFACRIASTCEAITQDSTLSPTQKAQHIRFWRCSCELAPEKSFFAMLGALTTLTRAGRDTQEGTTIATHGLCKVSHLPFLLTPPASDADVLLTVFTPEILFGVPNELFQSRSFVYTQLYLDCLAYYSIAVRGVTSGGSAQSVKTIFIKNVLDKMDILSRANAGEKGLEVLLGKCTKVASLLLTDIEVANALMTFLPPVRALSEVGGKFLMQAAVGHIASARTSLKGKCHAFGVLLALNRKSPQALKTHLPMAMRSLVVVLVSWVARALPLTSPHDVHLLTSFLKANTDLLCHIGSEATAVLPSLVASMTELKDAQPLSAKLALSEAVETVLETYHAQL